MEGRCGLVRSLSRIDTLPQSKGLCLYIQINVLWGNKSNDEQTKVNGRLINIIFMAKSKQLKMIKTKM